MSSQTQACVTLWLTREINHAPPSREHSQFCSLGLLATDGCGNIGIRTCYNYLIEQTLAYSTTWETTKAYFWTLAPMWHWRTSEMIQTWVIHFLRNYSWSQIAISVVYWKKGQTVVTASFFFFWTIVKMFTLSVPLLESVLWSLLNGHELKGRTPVRHSQRPPSQCYFSVLIFS